MEIDQIYAKPAMMLVKEHKPCISHARYNSDFDILQQNKATSSPRTLQMQTRDPKEVKDVNRLKLF